MQEFDKKSRDDEFFGIEDEEEDTQANKYMTFKVSKESFGIGIRFIREIIELQTITEVPEMPDFLKGVINLRGKVIPVIDLRVRFKIGAKEFDDRTCIIIIEVKDSSVGFIVDSVEEVAEIADKNIEPAPNFRSETGKEKYISGIGKVGDHIKIILDVEKILHEDELNSLHKDLVEKTEGPVA